MGVAIQEFNKKMTVYLRTFTAGLDKSLFLDVKCFQLIFSEEGRAHEIEEADPEEMKVPKDYIAYYWTEFLYREKKYRFTLFFKDFDHNTGNIHVLPGMFQFFRKMEKGDKEWFAVYKDKTSEILGKRGSGFEKPYCGHGGGRTYIEEGWEPCVVNEHGNKFYNIIQSDDCVRSMLQKINSDFEAVIQKPDAFNSECRSAMESGSIYDESLLKEIYGSDKGNSKGVKTYSMLRWTNYDENEIPRGKKEWDLWKKMKPLYSIVHIDRMGFFYILGQPQVLTVYDLNKGRTGVNTVNGYENEEDVLPDPYYWEINY